MISTYDANSFNSFFGNPVYLIIFFALSLWALAWKGIALWKAAHNGQRNWFVALLVFNTAGILEIVYIFFFQKKKNNSSMENHPSGS